MPDSITVVGGFAFNNCINVNYIKFSKNINELFYCTFNNMASLKEVTIPKTMQGFYINNGATTRETLCYLGYYYGAFNPSTHSYSLEKVPNFTIKGYRGTQAERYANDNGFIFVLLDNEINYGKCTLGVGENTTLKVPEKVKSWVTGSPQVVSVNNNGNIAAKSVGTTKVTAVATSGKSYSFTVTVKKAPSSVAITPSSVTLGVGESYTISQSTNSGSYAKGFTWSSSNTSVATVTKTTANKAKITAKGVGTATVTVKLYNGKTSTCKVTVKKAPSSVTIKPSSLTLGAGESYIISQSTNSGSYAKGFTWSSSNTSVATVTKTTANKAKITAKGVGTATVTVKLYNGKTSTCKVTVKKAPSSVAIKPNSLTLGVGESYTISQSTNSGSYAKGFTWSSSNTSVATVTKTTANKAKVTAKGVGTATVTVKLYNGKTSTCKVTVKKAPSSVVITPSSLTLGAGESYTISQSTNSGSYAKGFTWSSSNTSVVTVTKTTANKAKITAKGVGTATVTVKLYNGKTSTCKVTVVKNNITGQLSSLLKHNGKLYYSSYTPEATPGKYISNGLTEPLPKSIRNKAGSFTIVNNYIYYLDKVVYSGDYSLNVYRCNLDGTGNKLICSDYKNNNGFFGGIVCGNKFYYHNNSGTVVRNIDSGKVTVLSKEYIRWLGVSNKNIGYFCRDYKLYSYNFETNTQKCVTTDVSSVVGIEDSYVYYIPLHFNGTHIPVYKVNVTSGKSTHIFNASDARIAVSDGKVYYCEKSNYGTSNYCDYIKSYNLGTGVTETLQKVKSQYAYSAAEHFSVESGYITYLVPTGEGILVKQHIIDPNSKKDYVVSEFGVSSL